MTSEEFWKDDPQLFVSFRTSFINKKKREMEEQDYLCWLQGLYIHDGNGKLFASLKQFLGNLVSSIFKGRKDNTPIDTYPKMPYAEIHKKEEREKFIKEKQAERENKYKEFQNSLVYFGTLKQQYIEKLKKKQKEGE